MNNILSHLLPLLGICLAPHLGAYEGYLDIHSERLPRLQDLAIPQPRVHQKDGMWTTRVNNVQVGCALMPLKHLRTLEDEILEEAI
jgi:hypothetical protein